MNFRAAKFVLAGFLAISFAIPLFRLSASIPKKGKNEVYAEYNTPGFAPALALFVNAPADSTIYLERPAWTENE